MSINVNIKKIVGFALIYFMLLWNQTNVSELYLKKYIIPITILFFLLLCVKCKILARWSMLCSSVLFAFMIILRYTVGGIGIEALFLMLAPIMITSYVIAYNKEVFLSRFVKVVVFMSSISIILWLFCMMFPNIYEMLTTTYETQMTYKVYSSSFIYDEYHYRANGLFLYVMREIDNRNTGIFTEPGVYQMVINSALFILLMLNDYTKDISEKKRRRYIVILLLALISTQSTTGYIGCCLIILFYLFGTKKENLGNRRTLFIVAVSVILLLVVDYYVRLESSLLYVTIVDKLVTSTEQISLSADGSGAARWGTIILSLGSMIANPFGIGYDQLNVLMNAEKTGLVSVAILSFGAVWGVAPLLFVLWWLFAPVVKSGIQKNEIWLYVLLYFNTCFSQSSIFYPTLIVIPLFLYWIRRVSFKTSVIEEKRGINSENIAS